MISIAFTGPECSGKTTLAQALSEQVNGVFVPEYVRSFFEDRSTSYNKNDLDIIAKGQLQAIESAKKENPEVLLVDTEMLVMKIWSDEKFNETSQFISQAYQNQAYDLIVLCKPNIPYETDELRENPFDRERLYEVYLAELLTSGQNFIEVEGTLSERTHIIRKEIQKLSL